VPGYHAAASTNERLEVGLLERNPLGTMLQSTLERLSDLGVLEKREEPDLQYRWYSD